MLYACFVTTIKLYRLAESPLVRRHLIAKDEPVDGIEIRALVRAVVAPGGG
jgi:hypothetical protein